MKAKPGAAQAEAGTDVAGAEMEAVTGRAPGVLPRGIASAKAVAAVAPVRETGRIFAEVEARIAAAPDNPTGLRLKAKVTATVAAKAVTGRMNAAAMDRGAVTGAVRADHRIAEVFSGADLYLRISGRKLSA